MSPEFVLDLFRQALQITLTIVAAIVLPSLVVGLVVATFQAATSINEQTLSFLPRLVVTLLSLMVFGPWILNTMMEFIQNLFSEIPFIIG